MTTIELFHRQIVLDLTIRTLERDRKHLDDLKMQRAMSIWIEEQIKVLHKELKAVKSELYKNGAKLQSEKRIDILITEYSLLERGQLQARRYMNIALKNWVEEETKRLLGLPFHLTEDRQ